MPPRSEWMATAVLNPFHCSEPGSSHNNTKWLRERSGLGDMSCCPHCSHKPASSNESDKNRAQKDYYRTYYRFQSERDFEAFWKSMECLDESCWFYQGCTSEEAKVMLNSSSVGTFLLRNSSSPRHVFALSVKTDCGTTSVRITYYRGLFQLECEEDMKQILPKFDNIVQLVDFHVKVSQSDSKSQKFSLRWKQTSGKGDLKVKLNKPALHSVPTLKHLCRLTVNRSMSDVHLPKISSARLPVPEQVKGFLQDYPYGV